MKVLLVSEEGRARQAYVKALDELGVEFDLCDLLAGLPVEAGERSYHGVLLDVPTMVHADEDHKRAILELTDHFPVLRLRYDASSDKVRGLYFGQQVGAEGALREFVQSEAAGVEPRSLRIMDRAWLILNVLVHAPGLAPDEGLRAVTGNVSLGGCFVMTCEDFTGVSQVRLTFLELTDRTPIVARVKWCRPWGRAMRAPGFGAAFTSLTAAQEHELITDHLAGGPSIPCLT